MKKSIVRSAATVALGLSLLAVPVASNIGVEAQALPFSLTKKYINSPHSDLNLRVATRRKGNGHRYLLGRGDSIKRVTIRSIRIYNCPVLEYQVNIITGTKYLRAVHSQYGTWSSTSWPYVKKTLFKVDCDYYMPGGGGTVGW